MCIFLVITNNKTLFRLYIFFPVDKILCCMGRRHYFLTTYNPVSLDFTWTNLSFLGKIYVRF